MNRKAFIVFLLSNFITLFLIASYSVEKEQNTIINNSDKQPRLTFGVISDIHIRSGKDYRGYPYHDKEAGRKFASALRDLNYINRTQNALVINGDLTVTGTKSDCDCMNRVLRSNPHPKWTLFTIGNHEFYAAFQDIQGKMNIRSFPNSVTESQCLKRFIDNTQMPGVYYDRWIQGYHFIVLGSEQSRITNRQNYDNPVLSETQLKWLDNQLKSYQTNKPTFIFLHQPIPYATIGNSNYIINAAKLYRIVRKYPVIFFSGHSHETLREQTKIIYHDGFVVFNDSSVRNPVYAYHIPVNDSEGLYVQVYEGKVVIKGRDFMHRTWINQYTVPVQQAVTDF